MSHRRDREEPIDLSRRLGITPPEGEPGDAPADTAAPREDPAASDAVRETVSLRRAQRAHRRRRRVFGLLVAALVVLALTALGVVLWSTGVVGGS